MISHTIRLAGALALAVTLGACDSTPGPSDQGGQVRMNIATRAATAGAGPTLVGAPVEFTDSVNTLVIDKIEMVVKEVELKQSESATTCEHDAEGEQDDHDDCEELESGPFLLDLPLSTGATSVLTVDVVPGTYDEFEFKVHVPRVDDDSAGFLAQHPDFEGVSIRVTGTWNGVPFVYRTDLTAEQENDIVPPLIVAELGTTDLTLFIDIGTWFRGSDAMLIEPSSANAGGPNESTVENNIKNSFDSFEDEDHDGCDDHDDGSDGDGDHGDDDHSGEG